MKSGSVQPIGIEVRKRPTTRHLCELWRARRAPNELTRLLAQVGDRLVILNP